MSDDTEKLPVIQNCVYLLTYRTYAECLSNTIYSVKLAIFALHIESLRKS